MEDQPNERSSLWKTDALEGRAFGRLSLGRSHFGSTVLFLVLLNRTNVFLLNKNSKTNIIWSRFVTINFMLVLKPHPREFLIKKFWAFSTKQNFLLNGRQIFSRRDRSSRCLSFDLFSQAGIFYLLIFILWLDFFNIHGNSRLNQWKELGV